MNSDISPRDDDLESLWRDERSVEQRLGGADRTLARILDRALEGKRPSVEDAVTLLGARDDDLAALVATADRIRARTAVSLCGSSGFERCVREPSDDRAPDAHDLRESLPRVIGGNALRGRTQHGEARIAYDRWYDARAYRAP